MGQGDKVWLPLSRDGRTAPLIAQPLAAYQSATCIDRICLVITGEALARAQSLVDQEGYAKVAAIVEGGARRRDSVLCGLNALGDVEWVSVHDGARPLVTPELIERGLEEARETGAACCAVPASDTLKEAERGYVLRTLDRSRLWLAQTPQTFRRQVLFAAHQASNDDATDDAAMVEATGVKVRLYAGSPRNVKVTTSDDLALVEALLK
jgi:2-C-methyl-D-erythritol 4-phosphate cytidylyltransferase